MLRAFADGGPARLGWRVVVGTLVMLTVLLATRSGPILTPDSLHYVGAAQSLAAHGSLRIPQAEWEAADSTEALQQFPPAYPSTLALLLRAGASRDLAIRVVDAIAAAATIMLILWLGDLAASTWFVRIAFPGMVIALRAVPSAWISAWSEPLFIVAVLVTLAMMVKHARRSWTYGLAAAAGNAVRYAGVSLVLAAILWAGWNEWRAHDTEPGEAARIRLLRVVRAMLWGAAPGFLFNALWLLRARSQEVETPLAVVGWMGNLADARDEAMRTITEQLVPVAVPMRGVVACVIIAAICALVVYGLRGAWTYASAGADASASLAGVSEDARKPRRTSVVHASLLVAACYAVMLGYARLFVGGSIPLDDRVLAPLFLTLGLATVVSLSEWLALRTSTIRRAGKAVATLWIVLAMRQSVLGVQSILADRDDYGSEYWTDTPVADWLRTDGRTFVLYSDDPIATYFISGRPSHEIPSVVAADTTASFGEVLHRAHGALIDYPQSFDNATDAGAIARALGMCQVVASEDGNVWTFPNDPAHPCASTEPPPEKRP